MLEEVGSITEHFYLESVQNCNFATLVIWYNPMNSYACSLIVYLGGSRLSAVCSNKFFVYKYTVTTHETQ